jgi:hypothetical protein
MGMAVQLNSTAFEVLPASGASAGVAQVYGITVASQPTAGFNVTVQTGGWAKAIAGSSVGVGALLTAGIGTTALVPFTPAAAASNLRYVVGRSLEAAAAGGIFTVKIAPQQVN